MQRIIAALLGLILIASAVSCSPEAGRTQGGGPGADPRNVPADLARGGSAPQRPSSSPVPAPVFSPLPSPSPSPAAR